jgi:hypothetical protein
MRTKEFKNQVDAERWLEENEAEAKFLAHKKSGGFVAVILN